MAHIKELESNISVIIYRTLFCFGRRGCSNIEKKAFCVYCDACVDFTIQHRSVEMKSKNIDICYAEQYALCLDCGAEIYVLDINDTNWVARNQAYQFALNNEQKHLKGRLDE